MPSVIDPTQVKWKYFYKNAQGEIKSTFEKDELPEQFNIIALLTTSLFYFGPDKNITPTVMKRVIEGALNKQDGFCFAVQCEEGRGQEYYQKEFPNDLKEYQDLVMHDVVVEDREFGHMSVRKGVEQFASALEKGFHIWQMAGGGPMFDQKIALLRDYFREHSLPEDRIKTSFFGFSDGSSAGLSLREIVNFVHVAGAGKFFPNPASTLPLIDRESLTQLLQIFASKENYQITRELSYDDEKSFLAFKERYELVGTNNKVRHVTYFPRQLGLNMNSSYRTEFDPEEKLILSLEGYAQTWSGFSVSEVLYSALKMGVFKPEQVIGIVIENILPIDEEFSLRRINGMLPKYEQLTDGSDGKKGEKEIILDILRKNNPGIKITDENKESLIKDYIQRSNQAYQNEVQRIKEVAKEFEIPVIFGGAKRAGHSGNFVIQPTSVVELRFTKDKRIEEISTTRIDEHPIKVKERITAEQITPIDRSGYEGANHGEENSVVCLEKKVKNVRRYGYNTNVSDDQAMVDETMATVKLWSSSGKDKEYGDVEIVGGSIANLAEKSFEELSGKGVMCITPVVEQIILLLNSGRLGKSIITPDAPDVPFIIFSADKIEDHVRIQKTIIEEFGIEAPVFFTKEKLHDKGLPSLFGANINLEKMLDSELSVNDVKRLKPAQLEQLQE